MLLRTSLYLISELPRGYEYHQFQLLTFLLSQVTPNVTPLYIKKFEKVITRARVLKSQRYWTNADKEYKLSLYIGCLPEYRSLSMAWILLDLAELRELPSEDSLNQYLEFLSYLLEIPDILSSIPNAVLLVRIMEVFLLPNQYFLTSMISETLSKFLKYFAGLPKMDVSRVSTNTRYSSFYDFYNVFCGSFEAEGFCDAVFCWLYFTSYANRLPHYLPEIGLAGTSRDPAYVTTVRLATSPNTDISRKWCRYDVIVCILSRK